jgi:Co/Zn/Cd efflux system component
MKNRAYKTSNATLKIHLVAKPTSTNAKHDRQWSRKDENVQKQYQPHFHKNLCKGMSCILHITVYRMTQKMYKNRFFIHGEIISSHMTNQK